MAQQVQNDVFEQTAFLQGANAQYIEEQYARYLENPNSVSDQWREIFDKLKDEDADALMARVRTATNAAVVEIPEHSEYLAALDHGDLNGVNGAALQQQIEQRGLAAPGVDARQAALDSIRALMMIRTYRIRGHLAADLDPLRRDMGERFPELDPASYGFGPADRDRKIFIDKVLGLETATINEILEILKRTYCGNIGFQFMHMSNKEQRDWVLHRIEKSDKEESFTAEGRRAILGSLIRAEGMEKFLHKKYTGTKRFGIDGGEAMIPALEQIIKVGGKMGVEDIVLGMPHRGRLNVLTNVMAKPYRALFHEFKGGGSTPDDVGGSGDVKYHLGASSDRVFDDISVHLSLTANPSHLEAVNPVVMGKARAKQFLRGDLERRTVLPLLLHGDAAFAGQGIVAECLGLSGLKGHRTGGTIHFIVNNQIGFTTSPHNSRSSPYPSDVALMVEAPIIHVNGDDPEAVVYAARVATEFRQTFGHDVVVDMFCYRRFGHNEGDEPFFTQPLMYQTIQSHQTTLTMYADRLVREGIVTRDYVDQEIAAFDKMLSDEFDASDDFRPNKADWLDGRWTGLGMPEGEDRRGTTAVELDLLRDIGRKLVHVPEGFNIHRTLQRGLKRKAEMIETGEGVDWATGEALAFGTLMVEGFPVRLSGQDSVRGTFSQRHSAFIDQKTEDRYLPLSHLDSEQAPFEVIDSMLSEEAVLGFEYGYSLADPGALVLWEGQFGDFVNGAQVIIDQFISSGERKWLRMCGLVMLLPHGYEGQGPEHSSARLERFLQLCAEDNMQVANCTTPANYFHILRRQMHRNFRKPLILMTPKSLLRHKRAVSSLAEMGPGTSFHRVLLDDAEERPGYSVKLKSDDKIRKVVLCSGKVYYDLFEEREKREIDDVQLLRVEQLYPFPVKSLSHELERFPQAEIVWCQEEPKNMGGWSFVQPNLKWVMDRIGFEQKDGPVYAGRKAAASPAVGTMKRHLEELQQFLDEAFA